MRCRRFAGVTAGITATAAAAVTAAPIVVVLWCWYAAAIASALNLDGRRRAGCSRSRFASAGSRFTLAFTVTAFLTVTVPAILVKMLVASFDLRMLQMSSL